MTEGIWLVVKEGEGRAGKLLKKGGPSAKMMLAKLEHQGIMTTLHTPKPSLRFRD
jgi:hypothetical protein